MRIAAFQIRPKKNGHGDSILSGARGLDTVSTTHRELKGDAWRIYMDNYVCGERDVGSGG